MSASVPVVLIIVGIVLAIAGLAEIGVLLVIVGLVLLLVPHFRGGATRGRRV